QDLNENYVSTLGYYDGTFARVRSINLGYMLPAKVLSKAGISSMRAFVTVTNPFIIYSPFVRDGYGIDPEGTGFNNNGQNQTVALGAPGGSSTTRAIIVSADLPPKIG